MSSNESKQDSHKPPEQIQGHFSLRRSVWGSWRLREYSLDRRSRCHGAARISAMRVASTRRKSADGMLVDLGARIGQTRRIEIGRATSELQSRGHLVCRLLLEKKKKINFSKLL